MSVVHGLHDKARKLLAGKAGWGRQGPKRADKGRQGPKGRFGEDSLKLVPCSARNDSVNWSVVQSGDEKMPA